MEGNAFMQQVCIPGSISYHRITNAEGKYWLLPEAHLRSGWCIYQPSTVRGCWLKSLYPFLYWLPMMKKLLHVQKQSLELTPWLTEKIQRNYGCEHFEWSLFGGTPSARQKPTIQVSKGESILGYVKLSSQTSIQTLFRHESKMLDYLHRKGVIGLPRILAIDTSTGSSPLFLLMQDTHKTLHSVFPQSWTPLHLHFCRELYIKTQCYLPFEQTDFAFYLSYLQDRKETFEGLETAILQKALERVTEYWSRRTVYAAFHGDFTPWNLYVEQNQLYAFDWEYASYTFPPFLDVVYFVMQVAIVGKHLNAPKAYELYRAFQISGKIKEVEDEHIYLLSYLLYVLSFYMQIYQGHWGLVDRCYRTWVSMIKYTVGLC